MIKEYDLYNTKGEPVVKAKRLNIHSYNVKGYVDTPFANLYKRISIEDFEKFKKRFSLYTKHEIRENKKANKRYDTKIIDLLAKANYNLNISTGDLEEDNKLEMLGKYQLKQVMELLSDGKELTDSVKVGN